MPGAPTVTMPTSYSELVYVLVARNTTTSVAGSSGSTEPRASPKPLGNWADPIVKPKGPSHDTKSVSPSWPGKALRYRNVFPETVSLWPVIRITIAYR